MFKMNRSSHVAEIATTQYETAVLEAYGFMPVKENFPRFCQSPVHLSLIPSMLQLNDFGLSREEDSMNVDEVQTKVRRSDCRRQLTDKERPKITKSDVLKAHGII